jgi:uncharacterized protein
MIWILWHRRLGDLNQMKVLADALDRPYVIKRLQFWKPYYAPLVKLTFDKSGSDDIRAPWPDAVICAEALCSVMARRIKMQSDGKVKIISLARPAGDPSVFNLVLTTAQYSLLKAANIVELSLPLTAATKAVQTQTGKSIGVLIGGSSPPDILDARSALRLLVELRAYANTKSLPLHIVTSPRTPLAVVKTLQTEIKAPHQLFIWAETAENKYASVIDGASEIIVTSDSASMVADAVVSGKPTLVYALPQHLTFSQSLVSGIFAKAPTNFLFKSGIIETPTNRALLVERLIEQGFVSWFGHQPTAPKAFDRLKDINAAVAAVRALLAS